MAGNTLIFPTGPTGAALTSNNDIAAGTVFNSIAVQASGYVITGNGVGLAGTVDASQSSGSSTISLPITFNPARGRSPSTTRGRRSSRTAWSPRRAG